MSLTDFTESIREKLPVARFTAIEMELIKMLYDLTCKLEKTRDNLYKTSLEKALK